MKLKQVKIPTFSFRRVLPELLNGLGPDDCDEVFVEIEGRAGGSVNPKLVADMEALAVRALIMDKKRAITEKQAETNEAAAEKAIRDGLANNEKIAELQIGVVYDNCVVSWSTNICGENGATLEPTRENFLGLAQVKIGAIADLIGEFVERVGADGKSIEDEDEDATKN